MPRMASPIPHPRILVVDDDPYTLQFLEEALRGDGYDVRSARSGDSATREVESRPFELIVLDLMLPDADGLLLCDEFSRLGIPVLVGSGTTRHRDGILALRLGADDFIAKPFDLDELRARVARILASHYPAGDAFPQDPQRIPH